MWRPALKSQIINNLPTIIRVPALILPRVPPHIISLFLFLPHTSPSTRRRRRRRTMQSRRPLPALALVMPHPDLPSRNDPRTPRPNTPSTPIMFSKQLMASPRTSMESWGSSSGHPEEDVHWEWKPEQISLLTRVSKISLLFPILDKALSSP